MQINLKGLLFCLTLYRRGTIRRYMADDVIKQAAAADDDDLYNETVQTNTRLMVSPYSAGTLNYIPRHHHYQHHQPLQHLGVVHSTPAAAADKRWIDVTTIVGGTVAAADDDVSAGYTVSCAGGDRDFAAGAATLEDTAVAIACSATGRPSVCATHMYESPRFQ